MKRIAYFDTFAGISGDMILAAFLHAGVSLDALTTELNKLGLTGWRIRAREVAQHAIHGLKVDIAVEEEKPRSHVDSGGHHSHGKGKQRSYADIASLIEQSALSSRVKKDALGIFGRIAEAEAKIHGTTPEKVHFHEVGAVDSILDIVGAAVCLELLEIDAVYTSVVRIGSGGMVETQHGTMPIPAPATVEILRRYPVELTGIPFELTTPTGAGFVAALSKGVLPGEEIIDVRAIGYGAGSRELPGLPNLLRLMICETNDRFQEDCVTALETNIDDMQPEIYPYVIERLLDAGMLDAYVSPVLMKKGRPGHLLTVLTEPGLAGKALEILYAETTTTGVRMHEMRREKLPRKQKQVETEFGEVTVKVIREAERERLVPEFEECKRIAIERSMPLREVYTRIEHAINT